MGWKYRNKTLSFEEAIEAAREKGLWAGFPPMALKAMQDQHQDRAPDVLSPSATNNCVRQKVIQWAHDWYEAPSNKWPMTRGSAMHQFLEGAGLENTHEELKMAMPLKYKGEEGEDYEIILSGTCDFYDEEHKTLYDYKTTKTFYWYNNRGEKHDKEFPKPEHTTQTNLYVLLLQEQGFEVERAFLWYISASDGRKFVEVPLNTQAENKRIAYRLGEELIDVKYYNEYPEPYYEDDPEYKYMCKYCPVFDVCRDLDERGVTTFERDEL